ncbi:hypothetical protein ACQ4PT_034592 [Festuca glaucescens]
MGTAEHAAEKVSSSTPACVPRVASSQIKFRIKSLRGASLLSLCVALSTPNIKRGRIRSNQCSLLPISHSPPNRIESNPRDQALSGGSEEPMEAEACEITRLPEELLSAALSRTSPRDACRAATVSPAFRDAADSDAVWACFLPRDLPPLADGELPPAPPPPCKKNLFLRLSDSGSPLLLPDKLVSMWLDRDTGAKCYMLSARELSIVWGDTPQYWSWIPLADSRFSEGAQLLHVCWFDISGKIPCKMLSQDTIYAAYIVFKVNEHFLGLDYPVQEASVSVGETNLTRKVCLQSNDEDENEAGAVPRHYWPVRSYPPQRTRRRNRRVVPPHGENVGLPLKRADGWMELELGEFFNAGDGEDGEVSFSLMETKGGNWKSGLIVQGIEIRRKKSG